MKILLYKNKLLYKLANKIDWDFIENTLKQFYSKKGRPSHPIRLMAGLLILKYLRNISDEVLVDEQWEENIFYQYFCLGKLSNLIKKTIGFTFVIKFDQLFCPLEKNTPKLPTILSITPYFLRKLPLI